MRSLILSCKNYYDKSKSKSNLSGNTSSGHEFHGETPLPGNHQWYYRQNKRMYGAHHQWSNTCRLQDLQLQPCKQRILLVCRFTYSIQAFTWQGISNKPNALCGSFITHINVSPTGMAKLSAIWYQLSEARHSRSRCFLVIGFLLLRFSRKESKHINSSWNEFYSPSP